MVAAWYRIDLTTAGKKGFHRNPYRTGSHQRKLEKTETKKVPAEKFKDLANIRRVSRISFLKGGTYPSDSVSSTKSQLPLLSVISILAVNEQIHQLSA